MLFFLKVLGSMLSRFIPFALGESLEESYLKPERSMYGIFTHIYHKFML